MSITYGRNIEGVKCAKKQSKLRFVWNRIYQISIILRSATSTSQAVHHYYPRNYYSGYNRWNFMYNISPFRFINKDSKQNYRTYLIWAFLFYLFYYHLNYFEIQLLPIQLWVLLSFVRFVLPELRVRRRKCFQPRYGQWSRNRNAYRWLNNLFGTYLYILYFRRLRDWIFFQHWSWIRIFIFRFMHFESQYYLNLLSILRDLNKYSSKNQVL